VQYPATLVKSGAKEIRTPGLIIANDALYQLSYRPICPSILAQIVDSLQQTRFQLQKMIEAAR
jgi:hypothetical protein